MSERKADDCTTCHEEKGISSNSLWPSLAGQQEGNSMKSVKDLTDQDIAELAAHYNGLSPCS